MSKYTEPIYEKKVREILECFKQGKTKEQLAAEFGYANEKTLDNFMRRKNFSWDKNKGYYPTLEKNSPQNAPYLQDHSKAGKIAIMYEEGSLGPKEIAVKMGFESHSDLAQFMKAKNYIWDADTGNYIKVDPDNDDADNAPDDSRIEGDTSSAPPQLTSEQAELVSYLPLLRLLGEKNERLVELLEEPAVIGQVPRYVVPGVPTTKSIHFSNALAQMVADFSCEKNVKHKEIFEIALIEFFTKYGYEKEVKHLLKN
ncbi:hypothetical protein [Dethiobacter alkaliphilus]|uniref:Uncharacterized protein n=1 Tax=Dethiobacter alkaliphilus AHT 1 TaxID=555088 RepID=C0GE85_DETAL|nr:hypothetical protein [Dethiobacter alkaliphilus]EEG78379.1 conserved hypothetical protein [Dethiobacter alkaliphilus AHT 1]